MEDIDEKLEKKIEQKLSRLKDPEKIDRETLKQEIMQELREERRQKRQGILPSLDSDKVSRRSFLKMLGLGTGGLALASSASADFGQVLASTRGTSDIDADTVDGQEASQLGGGGNADQVDGFDIQKNGTDGNGIINFNTNQKTVTVDGTFVVGTVVPDSVEAQGVNWWPMGEGSQSTVEDGLSDADLSASNFSWVSGVGFNDNHINTPDNGEISGAHTGSADLTEPWTLLGWLRHDVVNSTGREIFDFSSTSTGEFLTATFREDFDMVFGSDGRTGASASGDGPSTNEWYMYAISHDGSGGFRGFRDASQVHSDDSGSSGWLGDLDKMSITSFSKNTGHNGGVSMWWLADSELSTSQQQDFINDTQGIL